MRRKDDPEPEIGRLYGSMKLASSSLRRERSNGSSTDSKSSPRTSVGLEMLDKGLRIVDLLNRRREVLRLSRTGRAVTVEVRALQVAARINVGSGGCS